MNKATIGRKVLLLASAALVSSVGAAFVVGKLVQHDPAQPFDATITFVHSDSLVNLVVHDHNGHSHALSSITLVQADADVSALQGTTYAQWPSYAVVAVAGNADTTGALATSTLQAGEVSSGSDLGAQPGTAGDAAFADPGGSASTGDGGGASTSTT